MDGMTRIVMKGEKYVFQKRERLLWVFHRWADMAEFDSFTDALIMKTMWVPEDRMGRNARGKKK